MDTPNRDGSWLESFPPDIWAYIVCYLPGEQLGRMMMTGATLLWQRLKSPAVVKSINLGEDSIVFKSFPMFLNEFPTLEELLIYSCSDHWSRELGMKFDSLPSGLRKLGMGGLWNKLTDKLFNEPGGALKLLEHLPNLNTLELGDLEILDCSWMADSPPSLTRLSLERWDGTTTLPYSLIHFNVGSIELSTSSFVSKLPPSLESFVVQDKLEGVDLVVPLLPSSMLKLSLGNRITYSGGSVSTSRQLFEQLPKSLSWFSIPYSSVDINFVSTPDLASLLPSTLAELKVEIDLPCSAWPLLPPQLTKLAFQAPGLQCTVASKMTDKYGYENEVTSFPFNALPRSITKLKLLPADRNIYFCGPPNGSKPSYFPPELKSLSIPSVQLSVEAAKLLPDSLTYLEVANFCERVCEHLPNRLKTLIAHRILMSPNLVKFLPRSLTFLRYSNPRSFDPWFDLSTGESDSVSTLTEYTLHEICQSQHFDWKDSSPLPASLTRLRIDAQELGDSFLTHQQLPNLLNLSLGTSKEVSKRGVTPRENYKKVFKSF